MSIRVEEARKKVNLSVPITEKTLDELKARAVALDITPTAMARRLIVKGLEDSLLAELMGKNP